MQFEKGDRVAYKPHSATFHPTLIGTVVRPQSPGTPQLAFVKWDHTERYDLIDAPDLSLHYPEMYAWHTPDPHWADEGLAPTRKYHRVQPIYVDGRIGPGRIPRELYGILKAACGVTAHTTYYPVWSWGEPDEFQDDYYLEPCNRCF